MVHHRGFHVGNSRTGVPRACSTPGRRGGAWRIGGGEANRGSSGGKVDGDCGSFLDGESPFTAREDLEGCRVGPATTPRRMNREAPLESSGERGFVFGFFFFCFFFFGFFFFVRAEKPAKPRPRPAVADDGSVIGRACRHQPRPGGTGGRSKKTARFSAWCDG